MTRTSCISAVTCPAITFAPEGLIFDTPDCSNSSAVLGYATECRFRCKSGYQHQGPGLKICGQSKTWTPPGNPFCTGKDHIKKRMKLCVALPWSQLKANCFH